MEKARDAQPANTRLTASLGDLYIRSGKPAEALALVNKDQNAANSVDLLGLKAAAQIALDQKDQARDTYSQILKLDPSALGARRALESLLLQTGDYEHARNLIKEGMAASPAQLSALPGLRDGGPEGERRRCCRSDGEAAPGAGP